MGEDRWESAAYVLLLLGGAFTVIGMYHAGVPLAISVPVVGVSLVLLNVLAVYVGRRYRR